jgi:hypothetical protein
MKKQFSLLFILLTMFFSQISKSQVSTDLRPAIKSPEVNKFEQYTNMPVNLVSGTPQIDIPIYTLNYSGMTLPISLTYDASGVKVESIASSVGQNWSLNIGGTVSRIIKGGPDEGNLYGPQRKSRIQTSGYYLDYGLSNLNNTLNTYSETGEPINRYGEFNIWMNDVFQSYLDAQPDLYYFSTPEGGAKFVFNDHREIVYLENTDFIIKETFNSNTNTFTWNATSPIGIKYSFGANSVSERSIISNVGELVYQYNTNAWFLNEMSNYGTNDKITLSYIDNNYSTIINKAPSKITTPCIPSTQNGAQCGNGASQFMYFAQSPNGNDANSPEIFSGGGGPNLENHLMSKLISKITAGKTEIIFIYSLRDDLASLNNSSGTEPITAQKLDEIQIIQNGQCIKKIVFNYTTAISTDSPPSGLSRSSLLQKRLVLKSFLESSCDGLVKKPYVFDYDSQTLPNKLSYALDKWGYYNGVLTNSTLVPMNKFNKDPLLFADRAVNSSFAKAGILQKITYPTKGTVSFEYEQHLSDVPVDFNYDVDHPIATLADISSTQSTTGTYSTVFTYNASSNETLLLETNMDYNPTGGAGCSSSTARAASIVDNVTNTIIAQINYQGAVTSKNIKAPIDESYLINQRQYTLIVQGYGGTNGMNYMCNINRTSIKRIPIIPIYDVGGLRVKKTTFKNDNNVVKENNYTYDLPKVTSNPVSIHKIDYNYINSFNELQYYPSILSNYNVNSFKNYIVNNNSNFISGYYYYLSSGTDLLDVNFIGPHMTYGRVIETDGNGKTESNFNIYKSYFELNGHTLPKQIPAEPKFQSILAGEKKSVLQYDQSGNIITNNTTIHNYNDNYTVTTYPVYGLNVNKNDYGLIYFPYKLKGQVKTLKTETETMRLNGQDVITAKEYEYNGAGHNQPTKIKTTNSKGELIETNMQYPLDLPTKPYANNLIAQNRKSSPLVVSTFKSSVKLSEQETIYDVFPSTTSGISLTLPKFVWAKKGDVASNPLEKKATYNYDTSGNLIEYTPENGTTTTMIWGYSKTQPIAKIENTTYAQVEALSGFGAGFNIVGSLTATQENTLRNSLSNTMLTTYTYKPLVGVSTITDPTGVKTYYEYDTFNRLSLIKDHNQNILQRYCYNYKGQQTDCSQIGLPTFNNIAKSGTFNRNNCFKSVGSAVTYTVVAGTYSSTISQADADSQAQTDVINNGQAYANTNGTCTAQSVSFTYSYDFFPDASQIDIEVFASSTNHSGATYNFRIFYTHVNGSSRTLDKSIVLAAGQTYGSTLFSLPAENITNLQLLSLIEQ